MRRKRVIGFGLISAGLVAMSTGCTHNHYYYTTPGAVGVPGDPCAAPQIISSARPVMNTPVVGSICDQPPQGSMASRNDPIIVNNGPTITPGTPIQSRPKGKSRRGGLAWRSATPENLATTKIEGQFDDDSTYK